MASSEFSSKAKWIWVPGYDDTTPEGKIVLFQKSFHLQRRPNEPCILKASADTRYRFFVNGHSVSFGPCKSYTKRWYYETTDITEHLNDGSNIFTARVLRFSNRNAGSFSLSTGPFPGLIVDCIIGGQDLCTGTSGWKARSDKAVQMISRNEWDYSLGPPFLALNERVRASCVSEPWLPAEIMSTKSMMLPLLEPWKLVKRPIPALPETPTRFDSVVRSEGCVHKPSWDAFVKGAPVVIPARGTVVVELESFKLTTGFLTLEFDATSEVRIRVMCSEAYELPMSGTGIGARRRKNDRTDYVKGKLYGTSDFYTSKEGRNVFEPFWFRSFRYVQLEIATSQTPATFYSFTYRMTTYPLDIQTFIQASPELEQMWEISLNTLQNCMHETYEDCPFYEQNQFIMDSRLQMLFTYQISKDDRLARKTMHEFHASRRDDGLLEAQFPSPGRCINIPQFSLFWVLMIYDHMMYFGDKRLVKQYLGTVDGILDYFDGLMNPHGLVGQFDDEMWPFIDWVSEWHGASGLHSMGIPPAYRSGAATYNSLIYAFVLQHAAVLCEFVGRLDTAQEYRTKASKLNQAVNTHCFDGEYYTDGPGSLDRSQHPQVFAVLAGAIDGKAATDLMRRTILDPSLPRCSYAFSFYVLRAAASAGIYDELFPQLVAPWRNMISQNLTTWAEDDVMFRSDCHGWSAAPINEIVSHIFGLSPASPGYGSVRIYPAFSLLPETLEGTLVTKHGGIAVGWKKNLGLTVTATFDVEALFLSEEGPQAIQLIKDIPTLVYRHTSEQIDEAGILDLGQNRVCFTKEMVLKN